VRLSLLAIDLAGLRFLAIAFIVRSSFGVHRRMVLFGM
jgi:hypothetical protein